MSLLVQVQGHLPQRKCFEQSQRCCAGTVRRGYDANNRFRLEICAWNRSLHRISSRFENLSIVFRSRPNHAYFRPIEPVFIRGRNHER